MLHYRQLFVKGDMFIGEWGIFGVEVLLHYSQFFIKGDFVIGRFECTYHYKMFKILVTLPKLHSV